MERLDRWTDPFDGPNGRDKRITTQSFSLFGLSSEASKSNVPKITVRTVPRTAPPLPEPPKLVEQDEIDWEYLANVLEEAKDLPDLTAMAPGKPIIDGTNFTVRVVPKVNRDEGQGCVDAGKGKKLALRPKDPDDVSQYSDFVQKIINDEPLYTDDDESDEDYYQTCNPLKSTDEDEEYRSDKTVQISMKEILDLFEDEYFVRGRHIPVDRLRKRLETIDNAQMAKIGFSPEQVVRLGRQICEQIQLLVQNAMLCGELDGAEQLVLESLVMLANIKDLMAPFRKHPYVIEKANPPLPTKVPQETDLDMPNLSIFPAIEPSQPEERSSIDLSFPNSRLEKLCEKTEMLVNAFARQLSQLAIKPPTPKATIRKLNIRVRSPVSGERCKTFFSPAYYTWTALFRPEFQPELCLTMDRPKLAELVKVCMQSSEELRTRFLPVEDTLLLIGLKKFGSGSWESIQSQLLPTRTSRQLQTRFKNMTSRRAPPNALKEINNELLKPLSRVEEEFLYRGVQRFGRDFDMISRHYLPHRPSTILRKLWEALDESRREIV